METPSIRTEKATPALHPPPCELRRIAPEIVEYTIIPHKNTLRFSYVWDVHNFRTAVDNGTRLLKSPVFSTDFNKHLRWSLILYPYGDGPHSTLASSIYLCLEYCDKTEVTVDFTFGYIKNQEKSNVCKPTSLCTFQYGITTATFGIKDFFDKTAIRQRLQIYCEIEIYQSIVDIFKSSQEGPFKAPDGTLLNGMQLLFDDPKYSDFTITVDGQEFPVHKAILSARSSVFSAMLEHDTEEQRNNRVDIKDTTPDVVKEMLRFIYTDNVINIETVVHDLLAAADKYALHGLKVTCENALHDSLTAENAMQILILADLHSADRLKDATIDFINTDTIEVMDSDGFKSMAESHPKLIIEILRSSATKEIA